MLTTKVMTSRVFHHWLVRLRVLACLFALVAPSAVAQQAKRGKALLQRITIGVLEPSENARDSSTVSSMRGITLGIEEAERTARLFGWEVVTSRAPDSLDADDAVAFLTGRRATAIIGNLTGILQQNRVSADAPVLFDIGKPRRRPTKECEAKEFHMLPLLDSVRWSADAEREPFARFTNLVAWSSSLERFGAAQLNERYEKRFGVEMDEHAWAGWMSVKILLEAVLKRGSTDPCKLERFLLIEARFDGHKGVPLFFDPPTRELVQPLFAPRATGEAETLQIGRSSHPAPQLRGTGASPCPVACA